MDRFGHYGWPFFEERHGKLAREVEQWAGENLAHAHGEDTDAICRRLVQDLGCAGYLRHCVADKPDVRSIALQSLGDMIGVVTQETYLFHASILDNVRYARPDAAPEEVAQAARAAGCPVFCVTYGYNEGADVRTLDVDAIVPTLVEAADLVRRTTS